jgi:hypothetical protein
MRLHLCMGLAVCLVTVTSAIADDLSIVNSKDWQPVSKTVSYFDAWSPSTAVRHGAVDGKSQSIWERLNFVTYRISEQIKGFRLVSDPAVAAEPSREPAPTFAWKAFSLENMYQVWDSPEFPVAVAISIQPRTSDQNVQIAETVVFGRTYDFWKWALNFSQGTEWSNRLKERDGALEVAWELSRRVSKHWSVGVELRDHSDLPEYRRLAASKLLVGPVVRCETDKWWLALSVMPRMLGYNFVANADSTRNVDFEANQKLSTRLMFGVCF